MMQPINDYVAGTAVELSNAPGFTDTTSARNPSDPTTVTLTTVSPGNIVTAYVYGSGDGVILRDGVGLYHAVIVPAQVGIWRYGWQGSGNIFAAAASRFRVTGIDG
jgi:hypothetical protein